MTDETVQVRKLTGGCGAEILGVDLRAMSNRQWDEVQRAFVEHGVVFFRDQELTPDQHLAFARRWAPIDVNRFFKAVPGHPEIAEVRKEPEQKTNIGGGWHTDHSYDQEPAMGSILLARELPEEGGDTLFANMYRAFETLSPGLQRTLEGMRAVHGSAHIFGKGGVNDQNPEGASRYEQPRQGGRRRRASGRDQASAERPQGALRQPCLYPAFRGLDGRGQQAAARLSLPARRPAGVHLPLPLARGLDRLLGQSRHLALRRQRLSRRAAADAPHHCRRLQARGRQRLPRKRQARPVISASWSSGA